MAKGTDIAEQIAPVLLDRRRMAAALCLSEDVLDRLRKQGCPCIPVPTTGDKRPKVLFDATEVVAWLKGQSRSADPEAVTLSRSARKADAIFGS